jgi:hypothetical protein
MVVGKAVDTAADMAMALGMDTAADMLSGGPAEDCMAEASTVTNSGACTKGSRLGSLSLQECMDCRSWEPS